MNKTKPPWKSRLSRNNDTLTAASKVSVTVDIPLEEITERPARHFVSKWLTVFHSLGKKSMYGPMNEEANQHRFRGFLAGWMACRAYYKDK